AALGGFRESGVAQASARAQGEALHRVLEHVDLDAFGASDAESRARTSLAAIGADAGLDGTAIASVLRAATRFLSSDYARSVRDAGARVFRERAFVVEVRSPDLALTLRGAMDLVVVWPNGEV